MKTRYLKLLFSICFIFFINIWLMTSVAGPMFLHGNTSAEWDGTLNYPMESNTKQVEPSTDKNFKLKEMPLYSFIQKKKGGISNRLTSDNPLYFNIIQTSKCFDRYCYDYNLTTSVNNIVNNSKLWDDVVVSHKDGMLAYVMDNIDDECQVNSLLEFNKILDEQDIPLVLFMPPGKDFDVIDDSYFGVYVDNIDIDRKKLITQLSDAKISFIDFSEKLEELGMNEDDIFFITDHHWLPQTALMACNDLGEYLNNQGFDVDNGVFDISNYSIEYSDAKILGSQGRKTTSIYADYEKLPIIYPLYDSDLTVFNSKLNASVQGTITETLFDHSKLEGGNPLGVSRYQFYGCGDRAYLGIHNNLKPDGKRILVIKESFADCMVPYMSNMAENIDVIDLRYFKGSLQSFINENRPDIVVIVYGIRPFFDSRDVAYNCDPFNFN